MDLNLSLGDPGLDAEALHALTVELRQSIVTHTDADAALVTGTAAPGSKGDTITLGTLALALVTSGALSSLVGVLQTFVARRPSIQFEVSRGDGQVLKLTADKLQGRQVDETLTVLKDFVGKTV